MPCPALPACVQRRQWLRSACASALACAPVLARSAPALNIRLSHVVAEETPKGLALQQFQSLVEQRSGGRIAVQLYPDGQLYGDHNEMQALQLGAVDMLAPSLSKFARIGLPEFELFDLPYLFEAIADVRRITQGPVGQRLLERLGRQRMVGLGYFDNGFKHMSANRPLLTPADFVGLRMRIQSSRVIAEQMRALGAHPVTLAFSETRRALATGVVDGTENPISNFWTQGMHEVQTDLSLTQHGYLGYAVVANQNFWQYTPAADRALIDQALRDALRYGNDIADLQNAKDLAALRAAGTTRIHTPSPAQRAQLRQALRPVHQGLAQRIGPQWMDAVHDALRKA